ncbi:MULTISPECIES: MFS transporter [Paracoccus]|uniref:MFS transporter n=1 Tax=Paracoccus TaxID=265 RepID=UPI0003B300C7|nr:MULTISPECIES: MFS transporter [Paracoccus]
MTSTDAHHSEHATIDEVVTTVIMARVTDFFGFFVYAIASALVFPELFFPNQDPVTGTLLSFAIFSLAFIARPIASVLGREAQKVIGRKGKVMAALMLLGVSTVAIGLLPGHDSIGVMAPILLAVFRFVQGLGLGGAWDGLTLQLQNAAPEGRKGVYGMVPQLGGPIGFCVAASIFFVLTGFLTHEEFLRYGWRFAFFAVIAVNVVSLFARLRLLETDFGNDERLMQSAPYGDLIRNHWRPIVLSTFLPLASYALFHMVTVFPLAYAKLYSDHEIATILLWELLGGSLAIVSVMASGPLADRFGRRTLLGVTTALIPLLCLTIGTLDTAPGVFIVTGMVLLGLAYGQASAIVPNRYPTQFRYSGSALSTNFSWLFGAAFAPLVGLSLTSAFGLWSAALYLLSGAIVTCAALYFLRITEHR